MDAKAKTVTPEAFIRAWQVSDNLDEVVERTGLSKNAIWKRVYAYREKGISLKECRRARTTDWTKLAALADELVDK